MTPITTKELRLFAELIHEQTGIVINDTKAYLLESRLAPLLEEYGVDNFTELFQAGHGSPQWLNRVVDAISTQETSFFRDQRPFELLRDHILPQYLDRSLGNPGSSRPSLQIWSAACATGQEAYSLCMTLAELLGPELERWEILITGTDISDSALEKARHGLYTQYEVERGVPPQLRRKYFTPEGNLFKISTGFQGMTAFKKTNLLTGPNPGGPFDIILCRNVAIYFNLENRRRLFESLAARLRPDGILIIGSTETLFGVSDNFIRKEFHNAVYFQLHPGCRSNSPDAI